MEVDLLLRFSLQPDNNNKVTCDVWNRGEYLSVLGWTELRIWAMREQQACASLKSARTQFPMETPEGSDSPLAPSTEDCAFTQHREETSYLEDGDVSQIWDAPTPVLYMNSQGQPRWSRSVSTSVVESQPQSLGFVQMRDWNRDAAYDHTPPTYIHYRINWRLMMKKTVISRNTIMNLQAPRRIQPSAFRGTPKTICSTPREESDSGNPSSNCLLT